MANKAALGGPHQWANCNANTEPARVASQIAMPDIIDQRGVNTRSATPSRYTGSNVRKMDGTSGTFLKRVQFRWASCTLAMFSTPGMASAPPETGVDQESPMPCAVAPTRTFFPRMADSLTRPAITSAYDNRAKCPGGPA